MDRDRRAVLHALGEIVALEQAGHGVLRRQPDHVRKPQRCEPFAVEPDLGLFGIEDLENLLAVGLGIALDLFAGKRRPGDVTSGRVADAAGAIPNDEEHGVAEILEVLHLADQNRVAEMEVGRGGIEPDFDAQGAAFLLCLDEAFAEILLANQLGQTLLDVSDLFVNRDPEHP